MSFILDYLVQPTLVGLYVLAKDVLYDEYLPDNPHVLIDVATNVMAKLVSGVVTVEFIVPSTTPLATWVEPLFHGAINGVIKSQFIDTDNLNAGRILTNGFETVAGVRHRIVPPIHHYTLENGFLEGAGYNLAAKLTALPLQMLIQ